MNIQLQLSQAQEAEQQKQWPQAIEVYKKVLEVSPDHKLALEKLAWCYSCGKQHTAAIQVLQDLEKSQSEVANWPYMIGYQYQEIQKYKEAIEWYDRALALKQDCIVVLYRKDTHTLSEVAKLHFKTTKTILQG